MKTDLAIFLMVVSLLVGFMVGVAYPIESLHQIHEELSEEEPDTVCSCLSALWPIALGLSLVIGFIFSLLCVIKWLYSRSKTE